MATILKAFRFALEPTQAQDAALRAWVPSLRFLWNWMLAQRSDAYQASEGRVRINYHDQAAQLPAMKAMFPWLGEVPSQPLQQTLMDLEKAFQRFFEKRPPIRPSRPSTAVVRACVGRKAYRSMVGPSGYPS